MQHGFSFVELLEPRHVYAILRSICSLLTSDQRVFSQDTGGLDTLLAGNLSRPRFFEGDPGDAGEDVEAVRSDSE